DGVARALPADTTLTSFNGSAGSSDGSSPAGPTITLSGCTPSHDAVATVIDRLRAVKDVDGVSLQSSTLKGASSSTGGGGGGGCNEPESFNLTVQLKAVPGASAAATAATSGTTPAASTPSTTTTPAAPAAA